MVLPNSKHHHLGSPDMFVSAPSSRFQSTNEQERFPPRKKRENGCKHLCCAKRWVWTCTTLSISPLFFLLFIRLIFMPKAQTPYIIKFSPEDLLLSSRKVSTKHGHQNYNNSLEKHGTALSLPIHKRLIFWTHRKGQKTSSAPSFPIWLASLPRLKIRRELASVLTLVSRYTLLFPILTKWIEFLYRFCLCSGM